MKKCLFIFAVVLGVFSSIAQSKKPVKNKELWIELDQLISRHTISWEWVKGHDGNVHNEKADYLARRYIEEA